MLKGLAAWIPLWRFIFHGNYQSRHPTVKCSSTYVAICRTITDHSILLVEYIEVLIVVREVLQGHQLGYPYRGFRDFVNSSGVIALVSLWKNLESKEVPGAK